MTKIIDNVKQKDVTKKRESNIELYRIVLMLLIIAHHYVVNSGLLEKNFFKFYDKKIEPKIETIMIKINKVI